MGVLGSIGRFAGGVAEGLETGSQIRTRNAAAQEQEERAARARAEDEESRADYEIGGQFTEGAMIPEGVDVQTYFSQLNSKRQQALAEAAAKADAESVPGRLKGALAGIRSRLNVRQVGEATGVTGGGIAAPTPPVAAPEPPPKMRPMTAREAAEGRALSSHTFNRKGDREKRSTELIAETAKERANEIVTLSPSEMGPALSRYANGRKIEVIPNQTKDGEEETFQVKMDGQLMGDGKTSRLGIVQLASEFAQHDIEGGFKVLALDREDRQRRQLEKARLDTALQNLATARYNVEQAKLRDPLTLRAAQRAEQAAIQAVDDEKFFNERKYTFLFDPARAEATISKIENESDKDNRSVWGERIRKNPDGTDMVDADGKPIKETYSILREEWAAQQEMARKNYYKNFMKPALSLQGTPVWQLVDAAGGHVFSNRNYAAVMDYAQRKWGGKPPPSVPKAAPAKTAAPAKAPAASSSTWRGPQSAKVSAPGAR